MVCVYSGKNGCRRCVFFVLVSSTYVLPLLSLLPDEPGERILLLIAPLPLVVVGVEVPRNVPVDLRRRIKFSAKRRQSQRFYLERVVTLCTRRKETKRKRRERRGVCLFVIFRDCLLTCLGLRVGKPIAISRKAFLSLSWSLAPRPPCFWRLCTSVSKRGVRSY